MIRVAFILGMVGAAWPAYANIANEPTSMTRADIAAYNAKIPRDHPNYILCFSAPGPGIAEDCRTNAEWARSGLLSGNPGTMVDSPNPKKMSQPEIRTHNARLKATDPYFIKCVRSEPTGSLVKTNFSCRTNQQWRIAEDVGNDVARAIGDEMASKGWRTSG